MTIPLYKSSKTLTQSLKANRGCLDKWILKGQLRARQEIYEPATSTDTLAVGTDNPDFCHLVVTGVRVPLSHNEKQSATTADPLLEI